MRDVWWVCTDACSNAPPALVDIYVLMLWVLWCFENNLYTSLWFFEYDL